jgi:hypothetical protein
MLVFNHAHEMVSDRNEDITFYCTRIVAIIYIASHRIMLLCIVKLLKRKGVAQKKWRQAAENVLLFLHIIL